MSLPTSPTQDSPAESDVTAVPPHSAGQDEEYLRAQEQLLQLRQQQEALERQKRELEALGQRQSAFEASREDVARRISRAVVSLEREQYEAERQVEHLRACREKLEHQVNMLELIDPTHWAKGETARELNRAEGAVEEAEAELSKACARINAEQGREVLAPAGNVGRQAGHGGLADLGFGYWLKAGLAFTLPLMVILGIAIAVFFYLLLAANS